MANHGFTNLRGQINVAGKPADGGAFASKLEEWGLVHLALDPTTVQVSLGGPRIYYRDNEGERHRYTADVEVHFHRESGRRPLAVEFKYASAINDDLRKKFELLEAEFGVRGFDFEVRTDEKVFTPELTSMKMAWKYHNDPASGREDEIVAIVRKTSAITLGELLPLLCSEKAAQLRLVSAIWRLVAHRRLFVNFSENLDFSAKIHFEPVV